MSSLVVLVGVRTISSAIVGVAVVSVFVWCAFAVCLSVALREVCEAFVACCVALRIAQPLHISRLYRTPVCHCSEE